MKLIVGLGNPGMKYRQTKHNIGFMVLDELARELGTDFSRTDFRSDYGEVFIGGEKVCLVKPTTYMNRSGDAIGQWATFYQVAPEDIMVVYDDLDLPLGKVRIRPQGGHGGHNGMRSLIDRLGTKKFNRLKVGIGRPFPKQSVTKHVLSPFPKSETETVAAGIDRAVRAVEAWAEGETIEKVMTTYNQ